MYMYIIYDINICIYIYIYICLSLSLSIYIYISAKMARSTRFSMSLNDGLGLRRADHKLTTMHMYEWESIPSPGT